ncbi:MAG: 50S ribosomal protein L5 [Planctomycetes bacterium SM23_32]|nr:MAG: 50S ribosomal protein L5 [Planctomycetes bacterium SM23_32]
MSETAETTTQQSPRPRLKTQFEQQVVPRLMERFGLKNPLAAPRLAKVVLNMGVGEAVADPNALNDAVETLREITGQQPVVTRARGSVAGFRLRQGMPVGCKVTLRRKRMYEFLDRLISIVLPRVRDFRGLSPDAFDGSGNYSLGLEEVAVFPELDLDKLKNIFGLDITIVTTAQTDQEGFELLSGLGVPFRQ